MKAFNRSTVALGVAIATALLTPSRNALAINEVASACQIPGAYLTETGLERLLKLGVSQIAIAALNPVDDLTTKEKKKIQKAVIMLAGGGLAMTVCPPLVVEAGFSDLPYQDRVDYAVAQRWSPIGIAPMDDLEVDTPSDPMSCQASVAVDTDAQGRINNGLDFPELEFVYVDPFGSFPNGTDLFDEILDQIRQQVMAILNDYLINLDPAESALADLQDLADRIVALLTDLGVNPPLEALIPGLRDFLLELMGLGFNLDPSCGAVDLECDFRLKFDKWSSNLLDLRDAGTIQQYAGGFKFPDGPGEVSFRADINTGFSTPIGYIQKLFVSEYFAPDFNVQFVEGDLNIIADYDYEALEPGKVDRSYTAPSRAVGAVTVTDNCDPKPQLIGGIPGEVQLGGPFFFRVAAVDRSGNIIGQPETDPVCLNPGAHPEIQPADITKRCQKYAIKVRVLDTRDPDVAPKDPIGISVLAGTTQVNFTDPDIGCTTLNCQTQVDPPIPPLQPPPVFDFATADPQIDCVASNTAGTDQPCASAVLPVGEISTIVWGVTDPSGNRTEITQLAALREVGTNQAPTASGTSVTVAQNEEVQIPLLAGDPEFDPISFSVTSLPLHGTLDVTPEAEFQTRFSATGTITDFVDALRVQGATSSSYEADILADPTGKRLVGTLDFEGVIDALYFETVRPDSIAFRGGDFITEDKLFEQSGLVTQSLLIGDWSTKTIHGLISGTNSLGAKFIPDAGFSLSGIASNPSHFEFESGYLFITDPDPANPANGKLEVVQLGNANGAPSTWTAASVRTVNLGYNAYGISRISHPDCGAQTYPFQFVIGDWDAGEVKLLDFSDNATPVSGGSTEPAQRTWDVSAVFLDPDGSGDNRPDIGDPQDLALLSGSCRSSAATLNVRLVDDFNKDIDNLALSFSSTTVAATPSAPNSIVTEFVRLFGVDALGAGQLLTLEKQRIAVFDLFGNLKSTIQTYVPDPRGTLFGSYENDRLVPIDASQWAAMDTDSGGNLYLLSLGGQGSSFYNEVAKVQVSGGSNNFAIAARQNITMPNSFGGAGQTNGRGIAFSTGPTSGSGDDRVYVLTDAGLERFTATLSSSTILFEAPDAFSCAGPWCTAVSAEFPGVDLLDVESDAMGDVYLSDVINHRVHKFHDDGSYVGWLGACTGGVNCDVPNTRSNGFLCTTATCTGGASSGTGPGQFSFVNEAVNQDKPRPSSAMLHVNSDAGQIYVTDNPDFGAGAVPRVQIFSLAGTFVSETIPDGTPGNILTSLDAGDFTAVNDLSTTADNLFIIEDLPLKRLHVFDINPFSANLSGATVTYTPDNGYSGMDSFNYAVTDSFGASSLPNLVSITVVGDGAPPVVSCPSDITVEANTSGGARRATQQPGDIGSPDLADFLAGATFSDDIQLPPPTLEIIPGALSGGLDALFPVNATTAVEFRATDGVGNTQSCFANVTVVDTIAPTVTAPPDITVEIAGDTTTVSQAPAECTDIAGVICSSDAPPGGVYNTCSSPGCGGTSQGRVRGNAFEVTVDYEGTDAGGNITTDQQIITFVDTTAPDLIPPAPLVASTITAINGYATPYSVAAPVASDASGIDGGVLCQPALSGTAASVPLQFLCQVRDFNGNLARTQFDVDIVQLNGDGDAFADVVDPQPGINDNTAIYSDVPLGGNTSGSYAPDASGGIFRIVDAYTEALGIRAEWIAPSPTAFTNSSVLHLCDDALQITGFAPKLDEEGDVDVNAVSATCMPLSLRNHLGSVVAGWTLPNATTATVVMPESAGLTIDGYNVTADPDNDGPIEIMVGGSTVSVDPGAGTDLESATNSAPVGGSTSINLFEDDNPYSGVGLGSLFSDAEDALGQLSISVVNDSNPGLVATTISAGPTLTLTPQPNANGSTTVMLSATDTGGASGDATVTVNLTPINDAPRIDLLVGVVSVAIDAGAVDIAVAMPPTPGPDNESAQEIVLDANNDNSSLFVVQPWLGTDGVLHFQAAPATSGLAQVSLTATDDGGTDYGGSNQSSAVVSVSVGMESVVVFIDGFE